MGVTTMDVVTTTAQPRAAAGRLSNRITSLDLMRGVVMVLMAIDHVRVYSGVPAGGPTAGVFFTRWITHFAAPTFAFLAGTAAYLHGRRLADRGADRGALSRYLATRGLWLVLLELTVLRVAWTFNFDFAHYLLAGVIWMLGWCMILLAALVWLPTSAIGAFGVAIIVGHNIMDRFTPTLLPAIQQSSWSWLWQVLYFGGPIQLGQNGPVLMVLYSIVPWIGVMAAGYAFGAVMLLEPERRNRLCVAIGGSAIVLFVVLRGFDLYGDPRPWNPTPVPTPAAASLPTPPPSVTLSSGVQHVALPGERLAARSASPVPAPPRSATNRPPRNAMPAALRFLNANKYPASLLFLLMTLGPVIALLPLAERVRGSGADLLLLFGRVPLFYYLLHIPTIHLAAIVVSLVREGGVNPWLFTNHPMMNPEPPVGYTWGLPLLYTVFVVVIAALYVPCRWFARVKARHRDGWLRYL